MGECYGTAHNMRTIMIPPVGLQSPQKDGLQQTETYAVIQPMMQTMIPGYESPKIGIGLGRRQIPAAHNDMK